MALPHIAGSLSAGAGMGILMSFLGALSQQAAGLRPNGVVFGAVLLGLAVIEVSGLPAQRLSRAHQVPLSWKHVLPASGSAALYGVTLGFGLGTTAYFWSFHALVVCLLLLGDITLGLFAGMAFALGRTFPVVASVLVIGSERLEEVIDGITRRVGPRRYLLRLASASGTAALAVLLYAA